MRISIILLLVMMARVSSGQNDSPQRDVFKPKTHGLLGVSGDFAFQPFDPGHSLVNYVSKKEVQNRFEVLDRQIREIKKVATEYEHAKHVLQANRVLKKDYSNSTEEGEEIDQWYENELNQLTEASRNQIEEILLPHQIMLIQAMQFQTKVYLFGLSKALSSNPISDQFETTEDQKKELAMIKIKAERAMKAKMEEMKQEAQKEMLKVLTAKQRKLIERLEGEAGIDSFGL